MKTLTKVLAAVAMLVAGTASMGCFLFAADEPQALKNMID